MSEGRVITAAGAGGKKRRGAEGGERVVVKRVCEDTGIEEQGVITMPRIGMRMGSSEELERVESRNGCRAEGGSAGCCPADRQSDHSQRHHHTGHSSPDTSTTTASSLAPTPDPTPTPSPPSTPSTPSTPSPPSTPSNTETSSPTPLQQYQDALNLHALHPHQGAALLAHALRRLSADPHRDDWLYVRCLKDAAERLRMPALCDEALEVLGSPEMGMGACWESGKVLVCKARLLRTFDNVKYVELEQANLNLAMERLVQGISDLPPSQRTPEALCIAISLYHYARTLRSHQLPYGALCLVLQALRFIHEAHDHVNHSPTTTASSTPSSSTSLSLSPPQTSSGSGDSEERAGKPDLAMTSLWAKILYELASLRASSEAGREEAKRACEVARDKISRCVEEAKEKWENPQSVENHTEEARARFKSTYLEYIETSGEIDILLSTLVASPTQAANGGKIARLNTTIATTASTNGATGAVDLAAALRERGVAALRFVSERAGRGSPVAGPTSRTTMPTVTPVMMTNAGGAPERMEEWPAPRMGMEREEDGEEVRQGTMMSMSVPSPGREDGQGYHECHIYIDGRDSYQPLYLPPPPPPPPPPPSSLPPAPVSNFPASRPVVQNACPPSRHLSLSPPPSTATSTTTNTSLPSSPLPHSSSPSQYTNHLLPPNDQPRPQQLTYRCPDPCGRADGTLRTLNWLE